MGSRDLYQQLDLIDESHLLHSRMSIHSVYYVSLSIRVSSTIISSKTNDKCDKQRVM